MLQLVLLFVLVPFIELALLIEIGQRIGALPTVAVIVVTGVLGAALARSQGLKAIAAVREELAAGRMPTRPLLEGVLILIAGAVLLTPGLLTDVAGFLMLIPASRRLVGGLLMKKLEGAAQRGAVRVQFTGPAGFGPTRPPTKDVSPHRATSPDQGTDDRRRIPPS